MELVVIVKEAGQKLGAKFEQDGDHCYLTTRVSGHDAAADDAPTQRVSIYFKDDDKQQVNIWAPSGDYSMAVNLAKLLRGLCDTTYARVTIGGPSDEDGSLEVGYVALATGLTAERLAEIVQEVADVTEAVDSARRDASA